MLRSALLGLLSAGWLGAQTTTANLHGIVRGGSGALVPVARVTLTNEGTGQELMKAPNSPGEFSFSFLRVGVCQVTIQADGFKRFVSRGLELTSGQQARLPFTMEPGTVSESVSVSARTPMVNTISAEQQQAVDATRVTELPPARGNFMNLRLTW